MKIIAGIPCATERVRTYQRFAFLEGIPDKAPG